MVRGFNYFCNINRNLLAEYNTIQLFLLYWQNSVVLMELTYVNFVYLCKWSFTQQELGKVPTPTHMGPHFTRHTFTPAQIAQLYHPPTYLQNTHPTINVGACTTSFGKYCPMWGCLPFHLCCHNNPPHTHP